MKKGNPIALLPIGVFLVLYLGLGLLFEYGMKIPMGFYNIPIVITFLVAILVACLQNRSLSFNEKLSVMGQGVGDRNIITMLLIFLVAGAFVGVVGRSSAQSVAYFMLSVIPPQFAVAVLFVVACFVSTAMGTSVGTITLLTPIAVEVAAENAIENGCEIECAESDLLAGVKADRYDVICANIVADIIIRMAPDVGKFMKDTSTLLASGIITERAEEVTDALEAAGLYIVESIEDNGWCALAVKKLIK